MTKLRHLFLTHCHLDHLAALPLLVDTMFDHLVRHPLIVHCLEATYAAIRRHIFNWEIWPDFFELPTRAAPVLLFEPLSPGGVYKIDGRRVEMMEANHTVPAAAYRIDGEAAALAFSGDTTTNDALWAALNRHDRLDVLLVECAFPEAEHELSRAAGHYCPSLLARDLIKLKHRPRTYITHLKPGLENATMQEIRQLLPEHELRLLRVGGIFEL